MKFAKFANSDGTGCLANVIWQRGTLIAQGFDAAGQGAEIGGAAVLWALVAVIVEQRSVSMLTTAAVCVLLVFLAMAGPWKALPRSFGRPVAAT